MVQRLTAPTARTVPSADAGEAPLPFPPRYRGVFSRTADSEPARGTTRSALSPAARALLGRTLPPDVATRLIGIVERMAAAAEVRDTPAE